MCLYMWASVYERSDHWWPPVRKYHTHICNTPSSIGECDVFVCVELVGNIYIYCVLLWVREVLIPSQTTIKYFLASILATNFMPSIHPCTHWTSESRNEKELQPDKRAHSFVCSIFPISVCTHTMCTEHREHCEMGYKTGHRLIISPTWTTHAEHFIYNNCIHAVQSYIHSVRIYRQIHT